MQNATRNCSARFFSRRLGDHCSAIKVKRAIKTYWPSRYPGRSRRTLMIGNVCNLCLTTSYRQFRPPQRQPMGSGSALPQLAEQAFKASSLTRPRRRRHRKAESGPTIAPR